MATYFANGYSLRLPINEEGPTPIEYIIGVLISSETRQGNSSSGYWVILNIKDGDNYFKVYFDRAKLDHEHYSIINSMRDKVIALGAKDGAPLIYPISEEYLRTQLLLGVANGNIKMEDLPAMLEFHKGNDALFSKWMLFSHENSLTDLEKKKEEVENKIARKQEYIEEKNTELDKLIKIEDVLHQERNNVLSNIEGSLVFLNGDDRDFTEHLPEYLIPIGNSQTKLIQCFEKFKTQKGLFVVSDGKIHRILYAYMEDKGRALLIGDSREYKTTKPEKTQEIIEEIRNILGWR